MDPSYRCAIIFVSSLALPLELGSLKVGILGSGRVGELKSLGVRVLGNWRVGKLGSLAVGKLGR